MSCSVVFTETHNNGSKRNRGTDRELHLCDLLTSAALKIGIESTPTLAARDRPSFQSNGFDVTYLRIKVSTQNHAASKPIDFTIRYIHVYTVWQPLSPQWKTRSCMMFIDFPHMFPIPELRFALGATKKKQVVPVIS